MEREMRQFGHMLACVRLEVYRAIFGPKKERETGEFSAGKSGENRAEEKGKKEKQVNCKLACVRWFPMA